MNTEEKNRSAGRGAKEYWDAYQRHASLQFELVRVGGLLRTIGEALEEPNTRFASALMVGLSDKIDFGRLAVEIAQYNNLTEKLAVLARTPAGQCS